MKGERGEKGVRKNKTEKQEREETMCWFVRFVRSLDQLLKLGKERENDDDEKGGRKNLTSYPKKGHEASFPPLEQTETATRFVSVLTLTLILSLLHPDSQLSAHPHHHHCPPIPTSPTPPSTSPTSLPLLPPVESHSQVTCCDLTRTQTLLLSVLV